MKKKLVTLLFAAISVSATASAAQVAIICGSFSSPTGSTGTFVCPGVSALGPITAVSGFVVYDSDYSNGLTPSVTTQTVFTLSGFSAGESATFTSDTVTTTGGSSSGTPVSADGLAFNTTTVVPPVILAGFYDNLTGVTTTSGSFNVGYVNTITTGSVLAATGYAEVVYTYTPATTVTPEPMSMALIGAGLIFIPMLKRKKSS